MLNWIRQVLGPKELVTETKSEHVPPAPPDLTVMFQSAQTAFQQQVETKEHYIAIVEKVARPYGDMVEQLVQISQQAGAEARVEINRPVVDGDEIQIDFYVWTRIRSAIPIDIRLIYLKEKPTRLHDVVCMLGNNIHPTPEENFYYVLEQLSKHLARAACQGETL